MSRFSKKWFQLRNHPLTIHLLQSSSGNLLSCWFFLMCIKALPSVWPFEKLKKKAESVAQTVTFSKKLFIRAPQTIIYFVGLELKSSWKWSEKMLTSLTTSTPTLQTQTNKFWKIRWESYCLGPASVSNFTFPPVLRHAKHAQNAKNNMK